VAGLVPGLLLATALAWLAILAHGFLPPRLGSVLSPVLLAILAGLVVGNLRGLPREFEPGIRFAYRRVLSAAIVLLGASLSLAAIAAIGAKALIMIVVLIALALVLTHGLGRVLGVSPKLATLLGVGTAVCGNTAISAAAPVIGAKDHDVSIAIATNTLFGTFAVFLYPVLGRLLGFDDAVFATWVGTAVNDTSQVVATGFAYSERAGELAITVKLTRNALMVVVIVVVGVLHRGERGAEIGLLHSVRKSIPLFVLGFLALSVLNTAGVLDWLGELLGRPIQSDARTVAKFLTVVALAGVGLGTKVSTLRETGLKPVLLGLVAATGVSLVSLWLIHWLGPVGG